MSNIIHVVQCKRYNEQKSKQVMVKIMNTTEFENMMAERLYDVNDEKLLHDRLVARRLFEKLNQTDFEDEETRHQLIKELFGTSGENIDVRPNFRCDYGYNIHVGENFFANFDCILLDTCPITIGKNALLAPRVQLYTASHPLDVNLRTKWIGTGVAITIGDNCWLGGDVKVVPGVTLGDNVVVGAGSVVTNSFGSNVAIAGNPARVIKELKPIEE